jgi:rubrerythrin
VDTDTTRLDAGHVPAATAEILDGLNDLLQLDHDAIGAYEIAMNKLKDRDQAAQIAGFLRDHERHIRELNEVIAELGGTPKNQPHATGPFKLALQSLGALAGDRGVLMAFRTNELQVRAKYDTYAAKANHWPTHIKRIIDGAALDEERHYRWVSDVMKSQGLGDGEGPELDGMDEAREKLMAHGTTLDQAKERVADVAGVAREHVADLSSQARERVTEVAGAVRNRISGLVGSHGATHEGAYADAALGDGTYATYGTETDRMAALRGRARGAVDGARGAGESFEHRYNERPLQTLVIAGIAGFVIGRLLR